MRGAQDERGDRPTATTASNETALLARAAALAILLSADQLPAVLDGVQRLDGAARLLRDALVRMADRDQR